MKNKNTTLTREAAHTEYRRILNELKSLGAEELQDQIQGFVKTLTVTKNIYARMGIVGRLVIVEKALEELLDTEKSLETLDAAFATHA
jgi:hypothetical protein